MAACSGCGNARDREPQRYCRSCHAAYMRGWRPSHTLTPAQRVKDNARSYANVYLQRGILKRQPCGGCGHEPAEMHHEDYSKPLDVIWLCREHHLAIHGTSNVGSGSI